MEKQYELYCQKDRLFYDVLDGQERPAFTIADEALPEGWQRVRRNEWLIYVPPAQDIPQQGWKIHVSACHDNAEGVLTRVRDYCVPRAISFKHLRSSDVLFMRNAKYAPRGGSGKLVTIYPRDEAELERILDDLGEILAGEPGPYILTDLRIGDGPLYVRYGGFMERHCKDEDGRLVSAIEDGNGRLVPDRRDPVFRVPDWVTVPDCLRPHLDARAAVTMAGLPYRVTEALHFSNGGGVYAAEDTRTGERVILKEGRPHAGLAAGGADAVTRLRREHEMLERLAGIDGVPAVHDYFTLGDHEFLVQEFVEGRPLNTFFAERHPLLDPEPDPDRIAEYTAWALKIYEGTERVVEAVHARGVVFNDLHMFNIMVRPDDTVALIDFETAAPVTDEGRQILANPGFLAPPDRRGAAVDRYCLACLKLALFAPLTTMLQVDRTKAAHLADVISEWFALPEGYLESAVEEISRDVATGTRLVGVRPSLRPDAAGWEDARSALSRAILASATPERDDRLFPGDIQQFGGGALGLAYGAAGVLYALDVTGCPVEHEDWLIRHATNPEPGSGLGLYDGLYGAAFTLAHLGHLEAAGKVVDLCLGERWERLGTDLYGGLPGVALTLERLAGPLEAPALRDAAAKAAQIVADQVLAATEAPARPGLLRGMAGPALMFIRFYERTGDPNLLDLAAAAIRLDLRRCVTDKEGALHVEDGSRILPYLGRGSVGIGLVIDDYLAHREDERLRTAREGIRLAAKSVYYAQAGLFGGRAGMVLYLARQGDPRVAAHIRDLAWHALSYEDGLAFIGENLLRLSMDLGTGTAGVLLALGAALHDQPVHLPFLAAPELPARTLAGVGDTDTVRR
ncbi:class III lanthionine synthetase LanKC [Actinoallomurus rhizosphaericola]|uniref:class III lanthionine synthetase LanKC n=1 Tax=Actinoallomurus rhizosphaericola TaxID=2952536 RepID=UPI002090D5D4|nr:class III lanthionine synthetase LanKC [Actinoallomurus rhizosphaericola]MCO5991918.1 class III lanthionine synthetase LanKC [Actinoallomurus rhizosphaericola]